jgi:hypothetical protein
MTIKLRFPKHIQIGSKTFVVKADKKRCDAEFSWHEGTLVIGTGDIADDPLWALHRIVHEVFEMWAVSLSVRYSRPDNWESYEFHFDHRDFDNLCDNASRTLAEFIAEEKP